MKMARLFFLLLTLAAGWSAAAATFGTTHPILGEFSDLALDEARGVIYLGNFTANRIEVFSLATRTLQQPIRLGITPSAVALSPDGRLLLILNFESASLFLLNLETRAVQTVAIPPVPEVAVQNQPRAAVFGSDGAAVIITTHQILRYDPATGALTTLENIRAVLGSLPVPQPSFPAEIVNARMAFSRDRNTIFAVGALNIQLFFDLFYDVPTRTFTYRPCTSLLREPMRFASIAPDGTRAMGGHLLVDRQLHRLADFVPSGELPIRIAPAVPTAPPPNAPAPRAGMVVGGHEFSRDGSTIYANLVESSAPGTAPVLYVLDSDNLTVRHRILIPDRLTGKMVSDLAGNTLYALSESGLTILPVDRLTSAPLVGTSVDVIGFHFNVCNRFRATASFDVIHRGGGSVDFTLSSDMPGLEFSPASGTTPARVTVTFHSDALFNVKGTTVGLINVSSSAGVNLADPMRVLVNLQDTDQRGTIFVQGGTLRDLLIDEVRERFYILDSAKNRLLVFDLNDFSLKQTVRTGYFPLNMAIAQDQRTLLVTNAQSETVSMINLDTLQPEGFLYCDCNHYARSIAVSTRAILLTSAVDRGKLLQTADRQQVQVIVTEGRMNRVDLASRTARPVARMGIFENLLSPKSFLTASPSGRFILIAEDSSPTGGVGLAKIYEAESDTFVLARAISERQLRGSVAASDTGLYNAGAVVMGSSLTPLAEFRDDPNEHNGLVFLGSQIVRTMRPAKGGGPGLIARVDTSTLRSIRPVKLAEAPLGLLEDQPLRRSLAATSTGTKFITLSSSGFTVVPGTFDAFVPPAVISSITNAATFREPVASGALIAVFGDNLAPLTTRAGATPLPTFLADSCLTVNNLPIPLLFLSSRQINGQMPFEIQGAATAVVHTIGGVSEPFEFQVLDTAPALFTSTFGGQVREPVPIIYRAFNQEPVSLSNPVRQGEVLFMFGNGFGRVTPELASGEAAPLGRLFSTRITPVVTIGGRPAEVLFAGLTPGFVGLNQLNIRVPLDAPVGFDIPLEITAGNVKAETVLVRVLPPLER